MRRGVQIQVTETLRVLPLLRGVNGRGAADALSVSDQRAPTELRRLFGDTLTALLVIHGRDSQLQRLSQPRSCLYGSQALGQGGGAACIAHRRWAGTEELPL